MVNNRSYSFLLKFCKLLLLIKWFFILRWQTCMLFVTFVVINIKWWLYLMIDKLTIVEVSKLIKMHGLLELLEVLNKFIKWWLHFIDKLIIVEVNKLIKCFVISKLLVLLIMLYLFQKMLGWRESSSCSLVSQIFMDSFNNFKPFFRNKILIYL